MAETTVRELAKQIKQLDLRSKAELIRLVPDLLRLDEVFISHESTRGGAP